MSTNNFDRDLIKSWTLSLDAFVARLEVDGVWKRANADKEEVFLLCQHIKEAVAKMRSIVQ